MLGDHFFAAQQPAIVFRRIRARTPQNSATTRQDARYRIKVKRHYDVFENTAPTFHETDEPIFVMENPLTHRSTDHRVKSGTIPTARQYSHLHSVRFLCAAQVRL